MLTIYMNILFSLMQKRERIVWSCFATWKKILLFTKNGIVYLYLTQTDLLKNIDFTNRFNPIPKSTRNGVHVLKMYYHSMLTILWKSSFRWKIFFLLFWSTTYNYSIFRHYLKTDRKFELYLVEHYMHMSYLLLMTSNLLHWKKKKDWKEI